MSSVCIQLLTVVLSMSSVTLRTLECTAPIKRSKTPKQEHGFNVINGILAFDTREQNAPRNRIDNDTFFFSLQPILATDFRHRFCQIALVCAFCICIRFWCTPLLRFVWCTSVWQTHITRWAKEKDQKYISQSETGPCK